MRSVAGSIIALNLMLAAAPAIAQSGGSPVDLADPLVGTAALDRPELVGNAPPPGEPTYSGQTSPGARVPHSIVEAAPVNNAVDTQYPTGVPTPYHYPNPTIFGFTAGGGSTYGARATPMLMPVVGDWTVPPAYPQAGYRKDQERAAPGYYAVTLDTGIKAELTATRSTGMMRYTFPASPRSSIILNLSRRGGEIEVVGDRIVRGKAAAGGRGEAADGNFFVARFSRPFASFGTFRKAPGNDEKWGVGDKQVEADQRTIQGGYAGAYLTFGTRAGEQIVVRMAHGRSFEEAERRLTQENPKFDFDGIHAAARREWAGLLDRVQVTGGTPSQRRLFYSTLFHSFSSPRLVAQRGETVIDRAGQSHTLTNDRYSPVPYWDTARNQLVLLHLLEPELVRDVMQSELDTARERGFMNTSFHGDHAVLMYLGSMRRGIQFDYAAAYDAMRRNATTLNGPRDHLDEFLAKGYVSDIVPPGNPSPPYASGRAGVGKTLEYSWDDGALADLASRLGRSDDAAMFAKRAGNWRNVFDRRTGFMRGRTADGRWISPFDPREPYYNFMMKEASGWSTLWLVPHDVPGLITAIGGRAAFNRKLDQFFSIPYAPKGICRDCTGIIGQYVQGNQPDQHAPYLYAWSGQPWKTQALVRRILADLYGSDAAGKGYPGMDDQGSTSSWYVMSAMGFYPVDPSTPIYVIGSPIFERSRIQMGNGRTFEIAAPGVSEQNKYIQRATLNGRPWTRPWFAHDDIKNGGVLELVMGAEPNRSWGAAPQEAPPVSTGQ